MAFVSLPSYSGAVKTRKRRRGHVHGRYNGRGLKGEKSRGGRTHILVLEGGQMPLVRRLPKRGFTNRRFAEKCEIINLAILEAKFDAGADISVETLTKKGLVTGKNRVKLLGKGKITKSFNVLLDSVSEGAAKKINEAGGSIANQKKAAQEKNGKAADGRESASVTEPK